MGSSSWVLRIDAIGVQIILDISFDASCIDTSLLALPFPIYTSILTELLPSHDLLWGTLLLEWKIFNLIFFFGRARR